MENISRSWPISLSYSHHKFSSLQGEQSGNCLPLCVCGVFEPEPDSPSQDVSRSSELTSPRLGVGLNSSSESDSNRPRGLVSTATSEGPWEGKQKLKIMSGKGQGGRPKSIQVRVCYMIFVAFLQVCRVCLSELGFSLHPSSQIL